MTMKRSEKRSDDTGQNGDAKTIGEMTEDKKKEVFEEEALPHMDALYNYARSLSYSDRDAEDLTQETVMRAHHHFHQYTPGTNCKTWLFTILRDLYDSKYKRSKTSPESVHYSAEEPIYEQIVDVDSSSVPKNSEAEFFENILPDEIDNVMESLPEKFRSCIVLSDVEDFSYEEVAEILDIPIGMVMSQLHRGRNIFEKKLVEYAREKRVLPVDEEVTNDTTPED